MPKWLHVIRCTYMHVCILSISDSRSCEYEKSSAFRSTNHAKQSFVSWWQVEVPDHFHTTFHAPPLCSWRCTAMDYLVHLWWYIRGKTQEENLWSARIVLYVRPPQILHFKDKHCSPKECSPQILYFIGKKLPPKLYPTQILHLRAKHYFKSMSFTKYSTSERKATSIVCPLLILHFREKNYHQSMSYTGIALQRETLLQKVCSSQILNFREKNYPKKNGLYKYCTSERNTTPKECSPQILHFRESCYFKSISSTNIALQRENYP